MQQRTQNVLDPGAVMTLVRDYFEGLYRGGVGRLRKIFDEHATLQAPGVR